MQSKWKYLYIYYGLAPSTTRLEGQGTFNVFSCNINAFPTRYCVFDQSELATKARQLFLYMVYSETVSLTVFTCLNITGLTK